MNTNNNLNLNLLSDYTLRLAIPEDAYEIWTVMDISSKSIEQKEHFICDDLDYVKDILSGHGFGVVACDMNGKIVGNLLVKYPGLDKENLGYDVFVKSSENSADNRFPHSNQSAEYSIFLTSENLKRVVHMDSASVHPEHRGHHLESRMIAFAETVIDTTKYIYSFATVSPGNRASLKSLERNGYQVMVTKEKYCGVMRCVMMKKLT